MKILLTPVPLLMYYFFKIVNYPSYISIRANNITTESIPNVTELLTSPFNAIKELVNIDEKYIQYVKSERNENLIQSKVHPFVEAVHMAYAYHVPLTITPDMIWYLIASGTSIHINQNAEKLRKIFVNHDGKVEIEIQRDDFLLNSKTNAWNEVVYNFTSHMEKLTKNNVVDLMTGNFSTTNNVTGTVSQLVLMDSMQKYFDYKLTTMCGIPEIRVAGTKQDWEQIKSKAKRVLGLIPDLNVWINGSLIEILDHFINSFDGKINKEFWDSIYKGKYRSLSLIFNQSLLV